MRIKPDDNWRWYFDKAYDRLMLDISHQILFCSRFPSKMLNSDAFIESAFNVDDASLYYRLDDGCSSLGLPDEQRAELVLNAVVAHRFLKPLMPKSWYFAQQPREYTSANGDIVAVTIEQTDEDILLLVVDAGASATLCLIAQSPIGLTDKTFAQGEAIKIMNDRIFPVIFSQGCSQDYAEAG